MNGPKTYKKDYFFKIAGSIRDLWNAQEILAARNIRRSGIQYFLAFPFSMIFINIQNLILRDEIGILGVSHTTATFSAFAAGAFVMGSFCNNCGASLSMRFCPCCGQQNAIGVNYCNHCGAAMDSDNKK